GLRGLLFERRFRFANALLAVQATLKLSRQVLGPLPAPVLVVLALVGFIRSKQQRLDLRGQTLVFFFHPPVAHRLVFARVGLHLGAVQRDMPQGAQSCSSTQLEHLNEQARQRIAVLEAERVDRRKVGVLPTRQNAKRYVLVGGALHFARREHPHAVRVQKQRGHHSRRVPTSPPTVLALDGGLDGRHVQLPHQLQHEVRKMTLRQPPHRGWRQQEGLLRRPRPILFGHPRNGSNSSDN